MKKYLTKAYLTKVPVLMFIGVMIINLIALSQDIRMHKWNELIATVALIVMLINWFIMWNLYDKTSEFNMELLDENWKLINENYQNRHTIKKIAQQLGVNIKDNTIDLQKVKERIDELKAK